MRVHTSSHSLHLNAANSDGSAPRERMCVWGGVHRCTYQHSRRWHHTLPHTPPPPPSLTHTHTPSFSQLNESHTRILSPHASHHHPPPPGTRRGFGPGARPARVLRRSLLTRVPIHRHDWSQRDRKTLRPPIEHPTPSTTRALVPFAINAFSRACSSLSLSVARLSCRSPTIVSGPP